MRGGPLAAAALLAGAAVAAAACGSPTSPDQLDLEQNRRRFRALVGGNYSCDYRNVAFLIGPAVEPTRMTVRNFQVVSLISLQSGLPVEPAFSDLFLSVDQIFDEIARAQARGTGSISVEYDPQFGYPRETFIDVDFRIADEERGFSVSRLVPE